MERVYFIGQLIAVETNLLTCMQRVVFSFSWKFGVQHLVYAWDGYSLCNCLTFFPCTMQQCSLFHSFVVHSILLIWNCLGFTPSSLEGWLRKLFLKSHWLTMQQITFCLKMLVWHFLRALMLKGPSYHLVHLFSFSRLFVASQYSAAVLPD